jgi:hypothetical protein
MYQLQNLIYTVWLLYPRHPIDPKTSVDSQCVRLKYGLLDGDRDGSADATIRPRQVTQDAWTLPDLSKT